jgi:hypothetical protein
MSEMTLRTLTLDVTTLSILLIPINDIVTTLNISDQNESPEPKKLIRV